MKLNKYGFTLFLIVFSLVFLCSLGAVSAANNIHDITIDDTNTAIDHPEANIHDSHILNKLITTDTTKIYQGSDNGIIANGRIKNGIISSTRSLIAQGLNGAIENSKLNNLITQSSDLTYIEQGCGGTVLNSELNNAITQSYYTEITQSYDYGNVHDSKLNNAIKIPTFLVSIKAVNLVPSRIVC